jgi:hypothetical protein
VAIARAKLRQVKLEAVLDRAAYILRNEAEAPTPEGEFWEWCYAPHTLEALCCFRAYFLKNRKTRVDTALCALILGLLHGPQPDGMGRCFSNHLPADFSPCPEAALRIWKQHNLKPPQCDVMGMIRRRAAQVLIAQPPGTVGVVRNGDSRNVRLAHGEARFDWIITSPPYYGMDTYEHDQWLRNWFLSGPTYLERKGNSRISQQTPETYIDDLSKVWKNIASVCNPGARMIMRIGNVPGIPAPHAIDLFNASLDDSNVGWQMGQCIPVRRDAQSAKVRRPEFAPPAPWPENETEVSALLQP